MSKLVTSNIEGLIDILQATLPAVAAPTLSDIDEDSESATEELGPINTANIIVKEGQQETDQGVSKLTPEDVDKKKKTEVDSGKGEDLGADNTTPVVITTASAGEAETSGSDDNFDDDKAEHDII
ncbi:unnamed protein product, partial [Allacma fusca]